MGYLKKVQYNCKKATYLLDKKMTDRISIRDYIELYIHLLGCSVCALYGKQTRIISEMVRQLLHGPETAPTKLDEDFKKELQDRIESELNK